MSKYCTRCGELGHLAGNCQNDEVTAGTVDAKRTLRWRKRNPEKYREYMRQYMRDYRAGKRRRK